MIQEGSLDGMLLVVQDDIDYSFLDIVEERQFPLWRSMPRSPKPSVP